MNLSKSNEGTSTAMDVDVIPNEGLTQKVTKLCAFLKEFGGNGDDKKHDQLDDHLNNLLEMVGNLVSFQEDLMQGQDRSKIEQSAIVIWNAAVTSGSYAGLYTQREIAAIRHVAAGLLNLCYLDSEDDTLKKKQLMMALKTAKAWLECEFPAMADKPIQLASKCLSHLESSLSKLLRAEDKDADLINKLKSELAQNSFKICVYSAEMAMCQDKMSLAQENVKRAKELICQLPDESPYLAMLCYNFGVKCFQEKKFEQCVEWLRESFDLSKVGGGCGLKNQARTLRLLASAYMEWDSEQYWQKALNAVELANSEYSHPAGLYLIIRVLLTSKTQEHRLNAAIEEIMRLPDLSVDVGVSVVKLLMDHDRKQQAINTLTKLNERYENSSELGNLRLSHLELLIQTGNGAEAKSHVEKCIIAHNTGKPMDVNIKKNFHIVLWDQAAEAYERKDFAEALTWYNYSLSLYGHLERHTEAVAKLNRNRTSCYIGLSDSEKALDAGRDAEKCDAASPQTHFLLFKVALLKDDKDMALKALKDMSSSAQRSSGTPRKETVDVNSLICLAAQLALEKNDKEIVILALKNLLLGNPDKCQALTALRCLTRIKISDVSGKSSNRDETLKDILQYIKSAHTCLELMASSRDAQSNQSADRVTEVTWFMKIAWNMALQCEEACREMKELYILCKKLSELCANDLESLMRQKTCMLMAAAVSLQLARDLEEGPQQRNELNEILCYVQECRNIRSAIQQNCLSDGDVLSKDTTTPLLLVLYEFEACAKLRDPKLEEILEGALSLPNTEPKAFETIAALAVEKPSNNKSLSIRALKIAIKKHLQMENTDFEKCSKSFHSLIDLTLTRSTSDAAGKEEALGYYTDVLDIIGNRAKGKYPEVEILWLMTKAWNCGIYYYSTSKYVDASRWCEIGMRFLKYLSPSLKDSYNTQMTNTYSDVLAKLDVSKSK